MNIVSYIHGSVIRFVSLDEILPEKTNSMAMYASALVERFGFQGADTSQAAINAGMLAPVFQNGKFEFKGTETPIISLDFQGNRIQAICSTTEQTLSFLCNMFSFLADFGFRQPDREISELLSSAIIVDYGPSALAKIEKLKKVGEVAGSYFEKSGLITDFRAAGIRYSGSVAMGGSNLSIVYNLEERVGRPPGTNWLFSHAPLSSEDHAAFLADIEAIFEGE